MSIVLSVSVLVSLVLMVRWMLQAAGGLVASFGVESVSRSLLCRNAPVLEVHAVWFRSKVRLTLASGTASIVTALQEAHDAYFKSRKQLSWRHQHKKLPRDLYGRNAPMGALLAHGVRRIQAAVRENGHKTERDVQQVGDVSPRKRMIGIRDCPGMNQRFISTPLPDRIVLYRRKRIIP